VECRWVLITHDMGAVAGGRRIAWPSCGVGCLLRLIRLMLCLSTEACLYAGIVGGHSFTESCPVGPGNRCRHTAMPGRSCWTTSACSSRSALADLALRRFFFCAPLMYPLIGAGEAWCGGRVGLRQSTLAARRAPTFPHQSGRVVWLGRQVDALTQKCMRGRDARYPR